MSGWLPEVEGWVKVAGAAVAVIMAILVPVRSWMAEDRRYKAQTLEAVAAASKVVTASVTAQTPTGNLLGDALAAGALTEAVRDIAKAIREGTAAEEAREEDRLAKAVEALIASQDKPEQHGPRRR
ncbi:hypothetical protein [Enterovirga sp. CN4-39]|uniref:hypothetical protein n=1 Tax=Enterovirga sp. CN4-39 TaxID=3400910 RepID=UPI003C0EF574